MAAGHVGSGPEPAPREGGGFIDKNDTFRVQIDLDPQSIVEPVVPLLQDVGAVLLDGVSSLFLRVMPRRTKKR